MSIKILSMLIQLWITLREYHYNNLYHRKIKGKLMKIIYIIDII